MRSGLKRVLFFVIICSLMTHGFLNTSFAGEEATYTDPDGNPGGFKNTGEISSEYGGYIYEGPDGKQWGAVATKGTGDNKPADGGAGSLEGIEGTKTITKTVRIVAIITHVK